MEDYSWLPKLMAERGKTYEGAPTRIERSFGADGITSALAWGEADASEIVYLHGGGQNAHTWDLVAPLVGTQSIAIDLPGHGHSSWRDDRDYRPDENATAVGEFLSSLEFRPRTVVGMSLGGLTALGLAAARPDLIASLVLVDILPSTGAKVDSQRIRGRGAVSLLDGPRVFRSMEEMVDEAVSATGRTTTEEIAVLSRGVAHNSKPLPDGSWTWRYDDLSASRGAETSHLWMSIERLQVPLTLVRGENSGFVDGSSLARLHQAQPSVHVEVAPRSGHSVQSEAPDFLAAAIRRHLLRPRSSPLR